MHPALFKLIALSTKSMLRRTFRGAKTVRGAFLLLFTIGILVLSLAPSVVTAVTLRSLEEKPNFSGMAEPYLPSVIMVLCLLFAFTSGGQMAFSFTPAEVDFLFTAPFDRRELLIYKLSKTILGLVFTALLLTISFLPVLTSWLSAFVGLMLTLALVQEVTLMTGMVAQIVAEHAYSRMRKLILAGLAAVAAAGLAQTYRQAQAQSVSELVHGFANTWPAMVVLAPFKVFSNVILADKLFPELVCWGAAAAAIDLGLLVVILKLDADYLESAAAISQKIYEQLQRSKQGGGIALPASQGSLKFRVPRLPWLGGAGPLAWRQILTAVRTSQYAIIMSLFVGVGLFIIASSVPKSGPGAELVTPSFGIGILVYLSFIFAMQLPWAFRGDIDHMDCLKSLPVSPLALVTGELAGGVALLWTIQLVLLAIMLATGSSPLLTSATAAFLLPFDLLMLTASNLVFLIYPVRMMPGTSADFQFVGRMMLFMLLQMLILVPTLGIPAGLGAIAFWISGFSWPVFAVTTWLVLVAELLPLLMLLAWTFIRFDPSTQTPA
jgi:Putative ABC exporter